MQRRLKTPCVALTEEEAPAPAPAAPTAPTTPTADGRHANRQRRRRRRRLLRFSTAEPDFGFDYLGRILRAVRPFEGHACSSPPARYPAAAAETNSERRRRRRGTSAEVEEAAQEVALAPYTVRRPRKQSAGIRRIRFSRT